MKIDTAKGESQAAVSLLDASGSIRVAIALYTEGKHEEALDSLRGLLVSPIHPVALNIAAAVERARGNVDKARDYWEQAVGVKPDYADAHNNLGVLFKEQNRWDEADLHYQRAIGIRPDYADAHNNLGNLRKDQGRYSEAEACYQRAVLLRPEYVDALNNLGVLLLEQRRLAEAETVFRRALAVRRDLPDVLNNLGVLLREQKRENEAEVAYRYALEFRPDYVEAHNNLGILLRGLRRWGEAEAAYRRALSICPDYPEASCNLGNLFKDMNRWSEAEVEYRRVIAIRPDYPNAYCGLGGVYKEMRRWQEAEGAYRKALSVRPDFADARFNLGYLLLHLGRFSEGWPLYEARFDENKKTEPYSTLSLPCPQWRGEDLAGKSLLVCPEQGFGDQIQFVRFLAMLKARGVASITLVCASPLKRLFLTLSGVDHVRCTGEVLDAASFDFWTYPISIPRYLGTTLSTIPVDIPYLHADPHDVSLWRPRLEPDGGVFRVGLVWRGRETHLNDRHRSLTALSVLAPLWQVPGVRYFSLQKGLGEGDAFMRTQPMVELGEQIRDFADVAAIVSQLDLVICVDTAVAHLAGSVGKSCWVLLPRVGTDWRWMENRVDSPWYPDVIRLFRQSEIDDWTAPVLEMAEMLHALVRDRRNPDSSAVERVGGKLGGLHEKDLAIVEEIVDQMLEARSRNDREDGEIIS